MATLSRERIETLLQPYLSEPLLAGAEISEERPGLIDRLSVYLDLLLRWNERMNLTSVHNPERIVERHFGESLFLARHLSGIGTVLDLGSGAGFPGLPIQLWHPLLKVTLAERQSKKATFLREVVRTLSLPTEVCAIRAEEMFHKRAFDTVVLRAVDGPADALRSAFQLSEGKVWMLGGTGFGEYLREEAVTAEEFQTPGKDQTRVFCLTRV
ncbi:MAG: hypothetical protein NVSMB3_11970 [Acidobacteriaceae bacterium]